MDDTLPALLPCPWCAAGQTLTKENGKMWTGQRYSDPVSVSVQHWCEEVPGQPSRMIERIGRDLPSAIAAWNRRPAANGEAVAGYVTEVAGGSVLFLPRASLNTAGMVPLYTAPPPAVPQSWHKATAALIAHWKKHGPVVPPQWCSDAAKLLEIAAEGLIDAAPVGEKLP